MLREISESSKVELPIQGYSIDGSMNNTELKIILPADLFQLGLGIIQPIISRHKLEIKESKGCLIVYDPTQNKEVHESQHSLSCGSENSKFYRKKRKYCYA